jgi:branched-chain amino acid transport system substrate-binding protein
MFAASGPFSGYGRHGRQAVQLAVDEVNAQGGVDGRRVEFFFEDDQMSKPVAGAVVSRYINEDRVDFLMGPTSSGVATVVSDSAKAYKIPLILTQAADPTLTGSLFHPYVFATMSNAMMHSRAGAFVAAGLPFKKWMTIYPNYSYGTSSWAMFKDKLQKLRADISIVGADQAPPLGCTNYGSFITAIHDAQPEAVWAPLWGSDAVLFIKQAIAAYPDFFTKIQFMIPDGASLEILNPVGADMPNGILMSSRYYFASPEFEGNASFQQAYLARFGEMPDYMAEETYAGVYFLKAAIERAGSTKADKFVEAVEKEPLAWNTPEGWKIMRKDDHQVVEDVLWGRSSYSAGDPSAKMIDVQAIQGETIVRTPEELAAIPRPADESFVHCARK